MKKSMLLFLMSMIFGISVFADTELRVLPHHWSKKATGRGRVKAEILGIDTTAFNTSSILMNGVAPLRTRTNPHKVIAFFPKSDVMATLGPVEKGQVVSISVSFSVENGPITTLTDEVTIGGKKKSESQGPPDNSHSGIITSHPGMSTSSGYRF